MSDELERLAAHARSERPRLVDTATAAEAVGVTPAAFRTWARRRGLSPVARVRDGRRHVALYRLSDVYAATRPRSPDPRLDKLRHRLTE